MSTLFITYKKLQASSFYEIPSLIERLIGSKSRKSRDLLIRFLNDKKVNRGDNELIRLTISSLPYKGWKPTSQFEIALFSIFNEDYNNIDSKLISEVEKICSSKEFDSVIESLSYAYLVKSHSYLPLTKELLHFLKYKMREIESPEEIDKTYIDLLLSYEDEGISVLLDLLIGSFPYSHHAQNALMNLNQEKIRPRLIQILREEPYLGDSSRKRIIDFLESTEYFPEDIETAIFCYLECNMRGEIGLGLEKKTIDKFLSFDKKQMSTKLRESYYSLIKRKEDIHFLSSIIIVLGWADPESIHVTVDIPILSNSNKKYYDKEKALKILVEIGTPHAVDLLIKTIRSENKNKYNEIFPNSVIDSLITIQTDEACEALLDIVENRKHYSEEINIEIVIQFLVKIRTPDAVDTLIKTIRPEYRDEYKELSPNNVIEWLGSIGTDEACTALLDILKNGKNYAEEIWEDKLARAILATSSKKALPFALKLAFQEVVIDSMSSEKVKGDGLAAEAIELLGVYRVEEALKPLMKRFKQLEDELPPELFHDSWTTPSLQVKAIIKFVCLFDSDEINQFLIQTISSPIAYNVIVNRILAYYKIIKPKQLVTPLILRIEKDSHGLDVRETLPRILKRFPDSFQNNELQALAKLSNQVVVSESTCPADGLVSGQVDFSGVRQLARQLLKKRGITIKE